MTGPGNRVPSGVHEIEISAEQAGQRIDNFLLGYLKGVPRSRIYRILRKGEVRVNRGRTRASYRLQGGDRLRIPPVRVAERPPAPVPGKATLDKIADSVIFEDKVLLAFNKPAGLAVHGGSGVSFGLIEALRALWPKAPYLELVHRLDRETSGCLLVARRRSALRHLHEQLREHKMEKQYLLLVKGRWHGGRRTVTAPLLTNTRRGGERMVSIDPAGKAAVTRFRPLLVGPQASLVEARPETGRTHQLRVHAASLGHPIAGDEKYGEREFNREISRFVRARLFLHARGLKFRHPLTNAQVRLYAPLAGCWYDILEQLELRNP